MGDIKDVLQADIVRIITTASDAVCDRLPKLIDEKTPELFDKVIGIVTTQQNKYRGQIMKDFKEGVISKLLGDKSIENMLKEILEEGTRKVFEVKKFRTNTGGQRKNYSRTITKKRKTAYMDRCFSFPIC